MSSTKQRLLAAVLCAVMALGLFIPAGAAPAMLGEDYTMAETPVGEHTHEEPQLAQQTAVERPAVSSRGVAGEEQASLLAGACTCSSTVPHVAGSVIAVSATNNEHWVAGKQNGEFVLSAATTEAGFGDPSPKAAFSAGGNMSYNKAYEKRYKMTGVLGNETVQVTDKTNGNAKFTVTVHVVDASAIPPCEHAAGWEYRSTTATCTKAGKDTEACKICGATREVDRAALGHDLKDVAAVAATCSTEGKAAGKKCSRCDYTEGGAVIPATGSHTLDSSNVCTVCGYEQHTEHTYEEVSNTATCTAAGVKTLKCSKTGCTETKTESVAALGHKMDGVVEHVEPTCALPGVVGGTYCTRCGDGDAAAEAVIPAKGHTYVGETCSVCGATKSSFTKQGGDFEVAYAQWPIEAGVTSYKVFVAPKGGEYTQIDQNLVREYPGYMRADAMGLKAGTYTLKVVPVKGGVDQTAMVTDEIAVKAHDRSGFGFAGTTTPGAYKADGTLKDGAIVIYVTDKNKDTVTAMVNEEGKGDVEKTGLQNIIDGWKKGKETRALDVRVIGNINDPAVLLGGDIVIENKNSTGGITIEGVGNDAVINGWGIRVKNANYVEISNLAFMNTDADEGDNIGVQQGVNYFWAHNNDLFYGGPGGDSDQAKGDGALDFKNSYYATFSYNHFWDTGKSCLGGMKNDQNYMTYHHNWFDHSDSRHPRVRKATAVHVYNNYYDGCSKYGIGAAMKSNIFADSNYFRNTKYPMLASMQGSDIAGGNAGTFTSEDTGIIKAYGNIMVGSKDFIPYSAQNNVEFDAYVVTNKTDKVPSAVVGKQGGKTYDNFDTEGSLHIDANYPVQAAAACVPTVTEGAGRIEGGDLQWEFDNAVEDANYGVIAGLKSALLSYSGTVVSVGGTVTQTVSGTQTHVHTPGAWKVTKVPGCNASNQELVEGQETQYCSTCGEALTTRKLAGQHSNNGSGTCTVCGFATGNGGGAVVSGFSKTLKYSDFKTTGDKVAITDTEMKEKADGYFKVFGTVNKRVKDGTTTMTSLQMAKEGKGGFEFKVENAPATVTVTFSSVDSNKGTNIVLKSAAGAAAKTTENVEYPRSSNSKDNQTVTYKLEEAGTYQLTSYVASGAEAMDARVYTLSVTETDEDDGGDDSTQETVSLTQKLTNLASSTTATRVLEGEALTITLRVTDATKYELPDSVTVTVGGEALEELSYNKTTGVISLTADQVSASIVITAAAKAKTGATTPVAVTGVTLNTSALTLRMDGTKTATLTATVSPSNADNKSVTWTSSDATVATVSAAGLVTALKAGTATITVKTADGNKTATCAVTVKAAAGTATTGKTYVLDIGKEVTESRLEAVDSIPAADPATQFPNLGTDGIFTIIAKFSAGTAIKAAAAGGVNGDKIGDDWASTHYVNLGGSVGDLSKLVSEGKCIKFTTNAVSTVKVWWAHGNSSNQSLALANQTGEAAPSMFLTSDAVAKSTGTLTTIENVPAGTQYLYGPGTGLRVYKVEVTVAAGGTTEPDDKPVTGVTVTPATLALATNGTKTGQLTATVAPADADEKAVSWSSSDEAVATVDQTGKVTAVGAGTATITVTTADGGFTATGTVTVSGPTSDPTPTAPDKKALNAAVTKAENAIKNIYVVGEDVKVTDVNSGRKFITEADKATYDAALAAAKVVQADPDATEAEIKAAVDALNDAAKLIQTGTKYVAGSGSSGRPSDSTTTPAPVVTMPFVDVADDAWFHDSVQKVFELGLMKGTDATHFAPDQSTSRAMVATVLFRLDGEKKGDVHGAFNDVTSGVWYTDAVEWAAEKGVVKGYSEDVFAPDDSVTREQLIVMLYRYANPGAADTSGLAAKFVDADSVSDWALEAIAWAVDKGIVNGRGNGILDPQGLASRAEICAMLVRFVNVSK